MWRVLKRLLFIAWITFVLMLASCTLLLNSCISEEEVARVRSPSAKVEAWLEETNGGATTSFGYAVYLHRVGDWGKFNDKQVAGGYRVFRSPSAYGMNLVWTGPRTLEVRYYQADEDLTKTSRVKLGDELIEVRVRSGVIDPTAPPGGMLYNLQGRPYD